MALRFILIFSLVIFSFHSLLCQTKSDTTKTVPTVELFRDTIPKNSEKLIKNPGLLIKGNSQDTLALPLAIDSLANDSTRAALPIRRSDIETTVNYSSQDSLTFNLNSQNINLFGEAKVDYGSIKLSADKIKVNWQNKAIKADYTLDSLNNKIGKPVFQDGNDIYETDAIIYNFQNRKAVITGVITEQEGGFMHGEIVKKNSENELFIRNAQYTTCNLANPHFHIQSNKLKVIPKNKIISGPLNLRFRDIPTFLWLPFGIFPQPKKKASGILVPSYGEERQRGFYLRDGGYYFDISDYADLRLTGDIYSRGGYALRANTNYKVRYRYSGSFNFAYTRNRIDDLDNPVQSNDFWVQWSHRPESRGNSSFSASVSGGSNSFNNFNNQVSQNPTRNITSQFTSNIGYRKTFQGTPLNLTANLRHRQNLSTGVVNLTAPEVTTNVSRLFPLKKIIKKSKSPLAKLGFSHNFNFRNEISNVIQARNASFNTTEQSVNDTLSFANEFLEILRRGRFGGRHQIPISTSFNLLKNFTVNPNINYSEIWYTKRLEYEYNEELGAVEIDTVDGFHRLPSFSLGTSVNTTVYGQVSFKKGSKIEAIRHVVQPSLSFSFTPESSNFTQNVQINEQGDRQDISQFDGFLFGAPNNRGSKRLSLSIRNNLEAKVKSKRDTITGTEKIKILDNFSVSTGYNFEADEFNLDNIRWDARTRLFNNKVNVNLNGTFDPYIYDLESEQFNDDGSRTVVQSRVNKLAFNNGQGIGTLQSIRANVSFSLRPPGSSRSNENDTGLPPQDPTIDPITGNPNFNTNYDSNLGTAEELAHINNNPNEYVDFNIPWSLNVRYNIGRTRTGFADPRVDQSLSFNGDLSITEKTKIRFNSGYDIERKEFTQTSISVNRDLHCWVLDFNWVPFGRFQSFNVVIRVRSSLLQDLKLERRNRNQNFFR